MADLEATLTRFHREVESFAHRWLAKSATIESERRYNFLKIRVQVNPETFIELYTNAQNERGSYALIHRGKRIFGYDGVSKWHCHPLDDPDKHQPCAKPRLGPVLREMKQIVESFSTGDEDV